MDGRGGRLALSQERQSPILYFLVKVYSIAANTFLESIRQPVFAVIVGSAAALIIISPYITMFTLQQTPRLVMDMGLATVMLAGMLLAAFTASNVISQEIENKTVLTVVSKPVGRMEFILGKFIGVMAGLIVATYLLSLALVLSVSGGALEADIEMELSLAIVCSLFGAMFIAVGYGIYCNFFRDQPFTSRTVGAVVPLFTFVFLVFCFVDPRNSRIGGFGTGINVQVIFACIMMLWSILVLAGIAIAASTRLTVVVNITLCSGLFLLGLLSQYLFRTLGKGNAIAQGAYYVTPNLQTFWVADYLYTTLSTTMEKAAMVYVPWQLVVASGFYAFCLLGALLFLAMFLFEERQLA
jgi:hypothetical protein